MTKCTPALASARVRKRVGQRKRELEKEGETKRRRDKPRENFGADALTTYSSCLLFFLVRPRVFFLYSRWSARSCLVRSFPTLPLTININLKSARESIEITGCPLSSLLFSRRRRRRRRDAHGVCTYIYIYYACVYNPCVSARTCTQERSEGVYKGGIRGKPLPRTTDVPPSKIDLPLTLYSLAPGNKRIFDSQLCRQTDRLRESVYSIFCSNNAILYDLADDRQP